MTPLYRNGMRAGALTCLAALAACQEGSLPTPTRSAAAETATAVASSADAGVQTAGQTGGELGPTTGTAAAASPPAAQPGTAPQSKQRVTFPGSRGDTVPGYLWLPQRIEGQKFPTVLLMYGIKGDKDDSTIAAAALVLNSGGYAAITIDWPGTGERGSISNTERITNPDIKEWTVGDYQATYNYLQSVPAVDSSRLGYVGASMGAMTGIDFTAREPRVKALAAVVPIPNPLWGADDPETRIGQIAPRPVLCIQTADNSDFSGVVCGNVGANGQKVPMPGGHDLEGYQTDVVNAVKTFLDQNLK